MAERIKSFIRNIPALLWAGRFFILSVAVAFVMFYAILLFSFWRVRDRVTDYLGESLKCEVKVERVRVSASLRVDLKELQLWAPGEHSADGDLPMLSVAEVSVWPDFMQMLAGRMSLRRIALRSPEFDLRRAADGRFNIDPWLKRSLDCNLKNVSSAFPRGVKISGGELRVWLDPDAEAPVRIQNINGLAGLAPKGQVGVRFGARVLDSDVELSGGMWPCSFESLGFVLKSENFDFSELYRVAAAIAGEGADPSAPAVPLGTGRLSLEVTGSLDSPSVIGGVSLRDFDADFSLSDAVLSLSNVKAGIGAKRVLGMGSVDFSSPGLPYKMEFDVMGLELEDLFAGAVGQKYSPMGELRGRVRVDGKLANGSAMAVRGDFTAANGRFRIPLIPVGPGAVVAPPIIELPFDSMNASVRVEGGAMFVEKIKITGKGYEADGGARIDTLPDSKRGYLGGFGYAVNISLTAEDAASLLQNSPLYRGLLSGSLKCRASISGDTRAVSATIATAVFDMAGGTVVNPYAVGNSSAVLTMKFDRLSANMRYSRGDVETSGAASGSGLALSWSGNVGADGRMSIRGAASVVGIDAAGFFAGFLNVIPVVPGAESAGYRSRFVVTGTARAPVVNWESPMSVGAIIPPPPEPMMPEMPDMTGVPTSQEEPVAPSGDAPASGDAAPVPMDGQ